MGAPPWQALTLNIPSGAQPTLPGGQKQELSCDVKAVLWKIFVLFAIAKTNYLYANLWGTNLSVSMPKCWTVSLYSMGRDRQISLLNIWNIWSSFTWGGKRLPSVPWILLQVFSSCLSSYQVDKWVLLSYFTIDPRSRILCFPVLIWNSFSSVLFFPYKLKLF